MSKTSAALEALVADVIANRPLDGERPTARQRVGVDRAFASILRLIAPRIRHFIRQYGLTAHWDDAEQVAAIAVHRAIEAYDPEKAQFTTFVNWQIRGEMQGLRFRLMTDQRSSAKKVEAVTVSLDSMMQNTDGESVDMVAMIEDEQALEQVEAGAAGYLAEKSMRALTDLYIQKQRQQGIEALQRKVPVRKRAVALEDGRARFKFNAVDSKDIADLDQRLERDRAVILGRLFEMDVAVDLEADASLTRERMRQIGRHASKVMADIAASVPQFAVMAASRATPAAQPVAAKAGKARIAQPVVETAELVDLGIAKAPVLSLVASGMENLPAVIEVAALPFVHQAVSRRSMHPVAHAA